MSDTLLQVLGADSETQALKIVTEWTREMEQLKAVTGEASLEGAFNAIEQLKAKAAEDGAKVVTLAAKVAELESEKEGVAKAALIAKLSSDGKAPPAMHAFLDGMTLEQLGQFADVAPAFEPSKSAGQPTEAAVKLSDADVRFCESHNLDKVAYLETVKAESAALEG